MVGKCKLLVKVVASEGLLSNVNGRGVRGCTRKEATIGGGHHF